MQAEISPRWSVGSRDQFWPVRRERPLLPASLFPPWVTASTVGALERAWPQSRPWVGNEPASVIRLRTGHWSPRSCRGPTAAGLGLRAKKRLGSCLVGPELEETSEPLLTVLFHFENEGLGSEEGMSPPDSQQQSPTSACSVRGPRLPTTPRVGCTRSSLRFQGGPGKLR